MTPIRFARLGVWSGRLEGFESNTMTKQLITKVGLELLRQLKRFKVNLNMSSKTALEVVNFCLILPKFWSLS